MKSKSGFEKLIGVYTELLCAFGCVFYLSFCACVMIQIISRNFLPSAPSWTEEAARYTFIYMVAFGCGVAALKDEFVFVEFLRDSLEMKGKHKLNKGIRIFCTAVMLLISVYILVKVEPTFCFIKFRMVSTAMQIPMQFIYFSQILLFGFLSFSLILRLIQLIRDFNTDSPVEESSIQKEIEMMKEEVR